MHSQLKYNALCLVAVLLLVGCAGKTSTVTVGGVAVEMPEEVAEEHRKIVDNIGIYDDPELDTYVRRVGEQLLQEAKYHQSPFYLHLAGLPRHQRLCNAGRFYLRQPRAARLSRQ